MRFALEILDGPNKGARLLLRNGITIGKTSADFLVSGDSEMADLHAAIVFDLKKSWNIECLAPNVMRLGFEEVSRATLILGLIFHLGQTGFKVVEHVPKSHGSWRDSFKEWLLENPGRQTATEVFFFLRPVRLSFAQGPQYEEVYTLSYGPRVLGFNNLDLNIKDPSAPPLVAKFFQIGDQVYVENLCGDVATINGQAFDQHPLISGDILRVSSSVIELSLLT